MAFSYFRLARFVLMNFLAKTLKAWSNQLSPALKWNFCPRDRVEFTCKTEEKFWNLKIKVNHYTAQKKEKNISGLIALCNTTKKKNRVQQTPSILLANHVPYVSRLLAESWVLSAAILLLGCDLWRVKKLWRIILLFCKQINACYGYFISSKQLSYFRWLKCTSFFVFFFWYPRITYYWQCP